ncbi:hypothetical protein CEXT_382371 [Caerostris extrusa]|uniref:Uncharacterized protein n=1 Tax=Caerostris extrusa TaxID=172846 RepID=A0AAV4XZ71_CAEEX|nr:hypothetical protein CEXT_382371 [Caerostris extrusa]
MGACIGGSDKGLELGLECDAGAEILKYCQRRQSEMIAWKIHVGENVASEYDSLLDVLAKCAPIALDISAISETTWPL